VAEKDSLILRRNTTQGLSTHSPRILYRRILAWRYEKYHVWLRRPLADVWTWDLHVMNSIQPDLIMTTITVMNLGFT